MDHPTHYQFLRLFGGSQETRNVSLLWRPRLQKVYALEDDQVMACASLGATTLTTDHRPMFTIETADGTSHSVSVSKLRITLRH